jgi:hypothetical protein
MTRNGVESTGNQYSPKHVFCIVGTLRFALINTVL